MTETDADRGSPADADREPPADADREPRVNGERVTLSVDSWAFEVAELPRVLPDGWTHFAVIAAGLEAHFDGVDWVGPDPEGAVPSDRHRYDATVTTDSVDHEHVRIVDRASAGGDTDAGDAGTDETGTGHTSADDTGTGDADSGTPGGETDADGEATTEAFDVSDALDRL